MNYPKTLSEVRKVAESQFSDPAVLSVNVYLDCRSCGGELHIVTVDREGNITMA